MATFGNLVRGAGMYVLFSLRLFTDWITPVDHYRIPEGHAVKVFGGQKVNEGSEHRIAVLERLRFFYWYGE